MLRREDSNKVLKGVKAIVFATTLSILNPVNIYAVETSQQTQEANYQIDKKNLVNITLGLALVTSLGVITVYNYKLNKNSFQYNKTKLDDDNVSNEKEAINDIKIICK